MYSIFISHSPDDTTFARRLSGDLTRRGHPAQTYADLKQATDGEVTAELLADTISSSDYYVPVITPAIQGEAWLSRDIERALDQEAPSGRVTILPVLKEGGVLPEALGVRSPVELSGSYASCLHSLIDRISVPAEGGRGRALSLNADPAELRIVKRRIFGQLSGYHRDLLRLEPAKFEEAMAKAFKDIGYEVHLTHFTREGGVDLVALGVRDGARQQVFQCKRYAPGDRLGVELVKFVHPLHKGKSIDEAHVVTTASFLEKLPGKPNLDVERLARSRWVLALPAWYEVESWLAGEATLVQSLPQVHRRHSELVDKKFLSGLSPEEQAELRRLQNQLDEAEAPFYEPAKRKFKAALAAKG